MRTLLAAALVVPLLAPAASLAGVQIHATIRGTGTKTVIFVHGWTCDETSWSEQVPVFEKNYRVITIDLPGHGKSEAPASEPLSMNLFARAIEAVRAEAGAEKIALVGHSMGTPVILEYARLYPSHVAALVPVDGDLLLYTSTPNTERFKGEDGLKYREAAIRGMVATASPAVQEKVLKMMLAAPEKTAIEANLSMYGTNQPGESLPFPALGIFEGGENGPLGDLLPNGSRVVVANTGHFIMLEQPEAFNKLLGDFLATVTF